MRVLAASMLMVSLAVPAWAQQPPQADSQSAPDPTTIDATKLGVDLARIQKGLRVQPSSTPQSVAPLRLEFQVQVYGAAPKIDLLKGFDLLHGAVPGSAPSHRQMIDFWTPQAFSAPTAPFLAMAYWAANQLWKKSKKTACEEEIANYRAVLMQGVNISAPRCTQ